MDRRNFLKTFATASGSALAAGELKAEERQNQSEFNSVLVDTTRCVGCRTCEVACAAANGLPEPDLTNEAVFQTERTPTESQWSVVNRYKTSAGDVYVKTQCMHCNQPACAAACLVKAMLKTPQGPVIWREDRCMGCRYCMISCPFDVPKFEYNSAVPRIQKCSLCWERLQKGQPPACVENCPAEALAFGKRRDLIDMARSRIHENPDKYVHEIYGEHQAGGTGFVYLSGVPFERIGLRKDVENHPYPELTKNFLYGVPVFFLLGPAFLLALSKAAKANHPQGEQ
jgi:Fe-S-cluster-containing dehydrogenase component